jgi:hypothetical protein
MKSRFNLTTNQASAAFGFDELGKPNISTQKLMRLIKADSLKIKHHFIRAGATYLFCLEVLEEYFSIPLERRR